ncbi:MAG: right-handed parallel beta-helix repeat-containing protein, partial [Candidatus Sericytochromatia bacterium]|nr:right-handed parallel beta-helix repeat-containing protein [Candidatus Tanganyikabacteria bacterium]
APTPAPTATPAPTSALYVSTSGSDANAGTSSSPLRTVSAAASRAKAGMTIFINAGTYYEQVITRVAGAAGQEIVFKSHNGTATIDGSNLSWSVGGNQNQGLFELRHPYVRLDGLKITNSKNTGVLLNADNLTVDNCEVSFTQRHAISTETGRQTAAGGTMIRNITLSNNRVHDSTLGGNGQGQPISLIADGFLVARNTVYNNKEIGIDIWLGARHGEVVDNDVYGNTLTSGIFIDGASYVRVHRNRVRGNLHGIGISSEDSRYVTNYVWVYNNLIYDHTGGNAMFIWEPSTTGAGGVNYSRFFNNTAYNNKNSVYLDGKGVSRGNEVFNNAGPSTGTIYQTGPDSYSISNNVWNSSGWVNAGARDFRLVAGAPQIDKGKAIPAMSDDAGRTFTVPTDFGLLSRVTGALPDAGAWEYR